MNMDVDIERLIPHRGRMKLVDQIIRADDSFAETEAIVTDRWPLFQDNAVSPLVLIELAAQTAAVCIGWKKLRDTGVQGEGRGWLVGIKSAGLNTEEIALNTKIRTRARITISMDNYTEIQGKAFSNDILLGEIVLQVMRDQE